MRFYEYESRAIVRDAGIPVTDFGFAKTPDEAREIAARIGGPTVIKSQVLSGGRMKAGGVQFADTPDEAAKHAEDILQIEIGGDMPRGVLVDPKAQVKQEYYAGVVWDGTRKRPLMLFSDMGGIDIEQVAEEHPDHVGRGHFSNLLPFSDYQAKQVIASGHPRPRGREPHARVPRLRPWREDRRRRDARPKGPRRARRAGVRHGPQVVEHNGEGSDGSVVTVPPAFTKDAVPSRRSTPASSSW